MRLADGWHHREDVRQFDNIILDKSRLCLCLNESHVHIDANGRATSREESVECGIIRTNCLGVLGQASGRYCGWSSSPVENLGNNIVSGLLSLFGDTVGYDMTRSPRLFNVATECFDRLSVSESESRITSGNAFESSTARRSVAWWKTIDGSIGRCLQFPVDALGRLNCHLEVATAFVTYRISGNDSHVLVSTDAHERALRDESE